MMPDANILDVTVIGVVALVTVFLLLRHAPARRTGTLRRSTIRRDRGSPDPGARRERLERSGRVRARETRDDLGGAVESARGTTVVSWTAPSEEALGVTRREFFNRGLLTTLGLILAGGGSTVIAFLWPSSGGGFGGEIAAGPLNSIVGFISSNAQPFYVPEARTYIVQYPASALPAARASKAYPDYILANMEQGIVALYQRCTHLGCRVPWCQSSQWFECPCHGSKYNRVGEKRDGPTPRGLDRFQAIIKAGKVTVNTGLLAIGPPIGTNTTGQVAEGPHCVG